MGEGDDDPGQVREGRRPAAEADRLAAGCLHLAR